MAVQHTRHGAVYIADSDEPFPWKNHQEFQQFLRGHIVIVPWDLGDGRGVSQIDIYYPKGEAGCASAPSPSSPPCWRRSRSRARRTSTRGAWRLRCAQADPAELGHLIFTAENDEFLAIAIDEAARRPPHRASKGEL